MPLQPQPVVSAQKSYKASIIESLLSNRRLNGRFDAVPQFSCQTTRSSPFTNYVPYGHLMGTQHEDVRVNVSDPNSRIGKLAEVEKHRLNYIKNLHDQVTRGAAAVNDSANDSPDPDENDVFCN